MVKLSIESSSLICEVQGSHVFWAVKSRLEIRLDHIRGVVVRPEEAKNWWHGWKVMGTDLPGVFSAGLFRLGGKWVFWDVRHPENTIEIDLKDEKYDRLMLEVDDPEGAAALIRSHLNKA